MIVFWFCIIFGSLGSTPLFWTVGAAVLAFSLLGYKTLAVVLAIFFLCMFLGRTGLEKVTF